MPDNHAVNNTTHLDRIRNEIMNQINIMDVVNAYGMEARRVGPDFRIRCPFHVGDKNASMSIQPQTQVFHCFSCKEKGRGALEFVYKYEKTKNPNYTLSDAIIELAEMYNLEISNIDEIKKEIQREKYTVLNETYSEKKVSAIQLNEKLNKIFEVYLRNNKDTSKVQAQRHYNYLLSRGLTPEIIDKFEIGFCPRGALLQIYKASKSVNEQTNLVSSGYITPNDKNIDLSREFYSDRITFPIKDANGNIMGFTGRTLDPRDAAKYKNSKESTVFQKGNLLYGYDISKDKIVEAGKIVLVEGNMDVVSSHQLGLEITVGLNGCAISDKQIEMIKSLNVDVILALDNDRAGHAGTIEIAEKLKNAGVKTTAIDISDFGNFKDNGEILEASIKNPNISNNFLERYLSLEKTIFDFRLKYELFEGKQMNIETIKEVYDKIRNNITSGERVLFKKYCEHNSEFSLQDIEDIINSKDNKESFYAQIGMMIIDPYLTEKKLNNEQKEIIVDKILARFDKVMSSNDNAITMNTNEIDKIISETFHKTTEKMRTQALKNEINCREVQRDIFTLEGMIERHKEMFKESPDAGVIRTSNIKNAHFVNPYEIETKFNELCQNIKEFPKNTTIEARVEMLTSVAADIISINMFEKKNIGRIERVFIEEAANELNLEINFEKNKDIFVDMYKEAVKSIALEGNENAFYNLLSIACEEKKEDYQINYEKDPVKEI